MPNPSAEEEQTIPKQTEPTKPPAAPKDLNLGVTPGNLVQQLQTLLEGNGAPTAVNMLLQLLMEKNTGHTTAGSSADGLKEHEPKLPDVQLNQFAKEWKAPEGALGWGGLGFLGVGPKME